MRRVCPQRAAAPGAVRHEAAPIRSPAVSAERLHRSASSWQRFALCFAERLASVWHRAAVLRIDRDPLAASVRAPDSFFVAENGSTGGSGAGGRLIPLGPGAGNPNPNEDLIFIRMICKGLLRTYVLNNCVTSSEHIHQIIFTITVDYFFCH